MNGTGSAEVIPLELGTLAFPADELPGLAGQACYTAAEWAGEETPPEGRSAAPDVAAYDRSIARLRDLGSDVVRFGHDRAAWTANPSM